jgi:hypothetical protein
MDPRVVEIFERWGFEWGGRWLVPDPMHFEFVRFVPRDPPATRPCPAPSTATATPSATAASCGPSPSRASTG